MSSVSGENASTDVTQELEAIRAVNSSLRVYLEHLRLFKKNLMAMHQNCQQLSKVNTQWIKTLNMTK